MFKGDETISKRDETINIISLQFESAKNINRNFTGMGCFISFEIDKSNSFSLENIDFTAFDWPDIHSTELEDWAYTIFFFSKDGVFDCIEIVWKCWDFPERELKDYIITDPEPTTIIHSEL